MGEFLKAKTKRFNSNTFLFIITIVLFIAMYVAGMIVFADKGFAKPQMFTNLFINNAGLIVIGCGMTIVMITGGIDISVGSVTALVCMASAYAMENKGMSPYAALCDFAWYWITVWFASRLFSFLPGNSAVYRYSGGFVSRKRTYGYDKYRYDFH